MEMVYRMDIYYIPSGSCQTPHHLLFVYSQTLILKFFLLIFTESKVEIFTNFYKQSFHPNLAFFSTLFDKGKRKWGKKKGCGGRQ